MSDIGQQFRMMLVTGTSPDGNVRATVTGERILRIEFRPHSLEWYDEADLERQLAGLAVNTWVAWTRERREISRLASGLTRAEAEEARRSRDRRAFVYEEALTTIECVGVSSGQAVTIRTTGMTQWHVDITDRVLRRLDVHRFTEELRSAFQSLLRDRDSKIALLKAEHFDIGLPSGWRRLA
ncbi:hypothetical protein Aca07nite_72970 [Actinoplanes capillaceus]|uniref:Uncharacterized protein n=1 Tax=Actinoplanes campanulatus TaxID=113559 RepID=A0ABQ3WUS2_9ACTN|nr:YbaB/EbfC family nucleoid-associated protein [Actinoplanes capillaceus]GID50022.1 hypothetical protein Aca07nite_72970 [Actinoplanes capillaceus]